MILAFLLILSIAMNIGLVFIIKRISKRLIQFDDIFSILNDDLNTNIEYLGEMLANQLMTNAPEIVTLDKNLRTMHKRFIEISEIATGVRDPEPEANPPVVA